MYIIFRWCCHCKCKMSGKDREGKSFPKKKIRLSVLFFLFLYSIVSVCIFFSMLDGSVDVCVYVRIETAPNLPNTIKKMCRRLYLKRKWKKYAKKITRGGKLSKSVYFLISILICMYTQRCWCCWWFWCWCHIK